MIPEGEKIMYVAIVDDNKDDARQVHKLLQAYLDVKLPKLAVHYEIYNSAEIFLQHFKPGRYAFVVLDIYMYEMNGMDAAQKVAALDKNCSIIFLTTSMEHALAGYAVHAAGYVLKPLPENLEQFYKTVDYCLSKLRLEKAVLAVNVDGAAVPVPLRDICFLDCQNSRFVVVHLMNRELQTGNGYQECLAQIQKDNRFLECYHRLLVNMAQIDVMDENDFVLKNGAILPISRRKKMEVKQAYLTYLADH
jgi:DNA-binding LytR/AlgR family response regulator